DLRPLLRHCECLAALGDAEVVPGQSEAHQHRCRRLFLVSGVGLPRSHYGLVERFRALRRELCIVRIRDHFMLLACAWVAAHLSMRSISSSGLPIARAAALISAMTCASPPAS